MRAWDVAELFDPALRVFQFRLGPSGGPRGLAGRGPAAAPELAWYVNGQLAPDLQLRRGLTYSFKVSHAHRPPLPVGVVSKSFITYHRQVFGGNDPHSANEYHPLIVTAEPTGGLERLSEAAQRAARVLAGVHYTRRGRLAPTAGQSLRTPVHRTIHPVVWHYSTCQRTTHQCRHTILHISAFRYTLAQYSTVRILRTKFYGGF